MLFLSWVCSDCLVKLVMLKWLLKVVLFRFSLRFLRFRLLWLLVRWVFSLNLLRVLVLVMVGRVMLMLVRNLCRFIGVIDRLLLNLVFLFSLWVFSLLRVCNWLMFSFRLFYLVICVDWLSSNWFWVEKVVVLFCSGLFEVLLESLVFFSW